MRENVHQVECAHILCYLKAYLDFTHYLSIYVGGKRKIGLRNSASFSALFCLFEFNLLFSETSPLALNTEMFILRHCTKNHMNENADYSQISS